MSDSRLRPFIYLPIAFALVLVGGIWLGAYLQPAGTAYTINMGGAGENSRKITNLLNYVTDEYVDSVDLDGLTESAIISLLDQLDPHSGYIPARELETMNQPLQGNFDGIGVEFNIIRDTIVVVAPISGGPSEKLGIRAGDRIVTIEDTTVAGIGIRNEDVLTKLRGVRGTKVRVAIARRGERHLIDFTITRDKIPIYSVDAGILMRPGVGYIKVSRFAATTYDEFYEKVVSLKKQGMKDLILDLRGNPGGYLNAAISMCDEILPKGKLIVYTEGRARPRQESFATAKGDLQRMGIAVLIDEGSASASEIVAGAIQDNDRGTVIGRRSFGKGLVQEQVELPDGSALRLTIARYYTPTGRCIQKPYAHGEDYYGDVYDRLGQGELYEADSIKVNKEDRFTTPGGKVVYGGGGIVPDVFVPLDTTDYSVFHNRLIGNGVLREFALELEAERKADLRSYKDADAYRAGFRVGDSEFARLISLAEARGISATPAQVAHARKGIVRNLRALIARSLWNGNGYHSVMNEDDHAVQEALRVLEQGGQSN
ncbi:MAG: PDZ domain-containing protein [Flavobacteriales bacterium]|nr:PDZ domain-containing protein [Flavobacteriales bacterium]